MEAPTPSKQQEMTKDSASASAPSWMMQLFSEQMNGKVISQSRYDDAKKAIVMVVAATATAMTTNAFAGPTAAFWSAMWFAAVGYCFFQKRFLLGKVKPLQEKVKNVRSQLIALQFENDELQGINRKLVKELAEAKSKIAETEKPVATARSLDLTSVSQSKSVSTHWSSSNIGGRRASILAMVLCLAIVGLSAIVRNQVTVADLPTLQDKISIMRSPILDIEKIDNLHNTTTTTSSSQRAFSKMPSQQNRVAAVFSGAVQTVADSQRAVKDAVVSFITSSAKQISKSTQGVVVYAQELVASVPSFEVIETAQKLSSDANLWLKNTSNNLAFHAVAYCSRFSADVVNAGSWIVATSASALSDARSLIASTSVCLSAETQTLLVNTWSNLVEAEKLAARASIAFLADAKSWFVETFKPEINAVVCFVNACKDLLSGLAHFDYGSWTVGVYKNAVSNTKGLWLKVQAPAESFADLQLLFGNLFKQENTSERIEVAPIVEEKDTDGDNEEEEPVVGDDTEGTIDMDARIEDEDEDDHQEVNAIVEEQLAEASPTAEKEEPQENDFKFEVTKTRMILASSPVTGEATPPSNAEDSEDLDFFISQWAEASFDGSLSNTTEEDDEDATCEDQSEGLSSSSMMKVSSLSPIMVSHVKENEEKLSGVRLWFWNSFKGSSPSAVVDSMAQRSGGRMTK